MCLIVNVILCYLMLFINYLITDTVQKMVFSNKNFFSKCDQIRRKLQIVSHLPKKSWMENLIFVQCHPELWGFIDQSTWVWPTYSRPWELSRWSCHQWWSMGATLNVEDPKLAPVLSRTHSLHKLINPFNPKGPTRYPLTLFWYFQGVGKGWWKIATEQ